MCSSRHLSNCRSGLFTRKSIFQTRTSSGFPARDRPSATGCLEITAAGGGLRSAGLTRSGEGNGTWGRGDWCDLLPGSAVHFLQSALYGRDAMPPHPRPLSPVSRGRGEDWGLLSFSGLRLGGLAEARTRGGTSRTWNETGGRARCPALSGWFVTADLMRAACVMEPRKTRNTRKNAEWSGSVLAVSGCFAIRFVDFWISWMHGTEAMGVCLGRQQRRLRPNCADGGFR